VINNRESVVARLLKADIDIMIKNRKRDRALPLAQAAGYFRIETMLTEYKNSKGLLRFFN
jgi:hypothetical protein